MPLILASSSPIRRSMLEAAGVEHEAIDSKVDESTLKVTHDDPKAMAAELAMAKALAVSHLRPGEWVIGSDSVVTVAGCQFDKAADRGQAAEHLRVFSGKAMQLTSAVALVRDGAIDWRHVESAELYVRPLSEEFIGAYLDAEWPEVSYCVGVFRMEGRGVQLFERIDGDYFVILGMPLIALLGALRDRELLPV